MSTAALQAVRWLVPLDPPWGAGCVRLFSPDGRELDYVLVHVVDYVLVHVVVHDRPAGVGLPRDRPGRAAVGLRLRRPGPVPPRHHPGPYCR